MIGYYAHHQGRGHLHRAEAFAAAWTRRTGEPVTGLSSAPRPPGWRDHWCLLAPDHPVGGERPLDPTARGALHWAPLGHPGLRSRAATVSGWIERARPRAVVVDVSVEMVLLVRLHGVPVVSVVQPGRRADPAHVGGLRTADALVCPWPAAAEGPPGGDRRMLPGLPRDLDERAVRVGAMSRFPAAARPRRSDARTRPAPGPVAVLEGTGGPGRLVAAARRRLGPPGAGGPSGGWLALGGDEPWHDDPSAVLAGCDVVVTHAGGGALADVAAARVPAVVVPGERPHDEQAVAARVLARGPWPVLRCSSPDAALHPATLQEARDLDGDAWQGWMDGSADRFVDVVERVALP